MSQNFSKKYLPMIIKPKMVSPYKSQRITIPRTHNFITKMLDLKKVHGNNSNTTLEIITDFDYTLTKFSNPFQVNQSCQSIFGSFVKGDFLPSGFKKQLISNYAMYGPYQTDGSISFSERVNLVGQLYKIQLKLFRKHNITANMIQRVTNESNIIFRSGIVELLQNLKIHDIPMYIVSGGISDMVYHLIRSLFLQSKAQVNDYHEIMKYISIHSNELQIWKKPERQNIIHQSQQQLDSSQLVRFRDPIVHSYNKYQVMQALPLHPPWCRNSLNYTLPNCILMGDLVSDIYMSRVHPQSITLSIFFAKEGQTDQRAFAEDKFDVIVEGDGSLKVVLQLLKVIKGKTQTVDWDYLRSSNKIIQESLRWL